MLAGVLEIQMLTNLAKLQSDMDQAKNVVGSSMKSITDAVELAKKALIAFAGIATVDAFASMVRSNITAAASLGKLATQAGVTVEAMSGLSGVGKLSGTAAETVAAAMNKMTKAMSGTTEEGKGAGAALRALGLNFDDFQKLSPDQRMLETARAMEKFQDGSGKSAVAMALMGKSGAEMLPYMKDLAEVGQLNAKVTTEQAAMAKDFDNNLKKVTVSTEAWKKEISMGMLPALDDASIAFLDVMNSTGGLRDAIKKLSQDGTIDAYVRGAVTVLTYFADIIEYVVRAVKIMGEGIGATIAAIITQFSGLGAAIKLALSGEFSAAGDALKTSFSQSKTIVTEYGKSIIDTFGADTMGKKFRDRMEDVKGLSAATAKAKAEADKLKPRLADDFNQKVGGAGGKSAAEKESEYAKFFKQIQAKIELDTKVLALGRELTEAEGFRVKITNDMNLAKVALTATERKAIEVKLAEKEALDLLMQVQKSEFDQAKQIALERQRIRNADYDQTQQFIFGERESENARNKSMRDTLQGLADETAVLGMTNAQREIAIKLREAEKMGLDKASIAYSVYAEKIRAAVVNKEAVEDGVKSQVGMWQTIEGAAKGTFLSIFDSGKNAFTRLKDTLKNGLYALLYEITVKKWLITIAATVSGAGVAQQALGATSGGDGIGSLLSSASSIGSLASGAGMLGAAGLGLQAGFGALMTGGFAGVSAAVSGGLAAIGVGTGAGIAAGLGTIAGALGPIALGAFAVYTLLNKDSKPTSSTGDSQIRFDAAGNETSRLDLNTAAFKAMASSSSDAIVKGVQASYASAATALGIAASASAFAYSGNTGKGGEKPNFSLSGGAGGGYYNSGDVATSDAAMQLEMSRVLFASIQGSDLPKYLKGAFDGMAAGSMSTEQINTVIKSAQELKVFNDQLKALPFANLADLSYQATAALIAASGGLQALQTNLGNYYKDFYTAEEQRLNTIQQINEKTAGSGLDAATATRESFRQIVEAQDLTTLSGQKMYAALLTVAGAFAGITPASKEAETAIVKISDAMKRMQSDTATLQIELMRAQGNTFGANNAQYKIDTAGLTAAEKTIFDYNAGIRSQITALGAAKVAGDELISTNKAAADAALADSKAAAVAAFTDLQRSIAAEKSRLTVIRDIDAEFLRSVTSVFDLLKTQVSELYKSVDSTRKMQAAQGDAFIENALSSAKATGYLPNAKDLAEAIAAARTGIDSTQFASRFEAEKATLVMAGKLSELQTISDHQLKTADKTLQTDNEQIVKLDQTLALYQQQIDALNSVNGNVGNVNGSVLSVQEAITALTAAILAALQAQNAAKQSVAAAIPATAPPVKVAADAYVAALPSDKTFNPAAANPFTEREQQIQAIYKSVLGRIADAGGLSDFSKSSLTLDQITDALKGSAEAAARAISVAYQNAFNARVNANLGLTSTIQAFANGGDHMGGLRIVGENGPELESTGPSRIFTANQTRSMLSGDNSDMVSELRALRQEVSQLRSSQDRGNEYGKIAADRLDGRQGQPFLVQVTA